MTGFPVFEPRVVVYTRGSKIKAQISSLTLQCRLCLLGHLVHIDTITFPSRCMCAHYLRKSVWDQKQGFNDLISRDLQRCGLVTPGFALLDLRMYVTSFHHFMYLRIMRSTSVTIQSTSSAESPGWGTETPPACWQSNCSSDWSSYSSPFPWVLYYNVHVFACVCTVYITGSAHACLPYNYWPDRGVRKA